MGAGFTLRGGVERIGSLPGLVFVPTCVCSFSLLALSGFFGGDGLTLRGGIERMGSLGGLVFVTTGVGCFLLLALSGFFFGGGVEAILDILFLIEGDDTFRFCLGEPVGEDVELD